MADRQHVPFGDILNIPRRTSFRTHKLESSLLFAFLKKGTPTLRNHRLEAGLYKVIQMAADNLFSRETQELAGADTRL
jgi:hypothetical protein